MTHLSIFTCPVLLQTISLDGNSLSECKESKGCIWDQKYQECTTTPVLPERVRASIYFPCLGLYQPLDNREEQRVVSDLEGAIRNRTGLSQKSMHSFELKKSNTLLGRVMNFTIQGILNQKRVSAIWWDLKNQLEKGHNFVLTIGKHTYHSSTQPTTYEDITNMEINVDFVSLNTDGLLQSHPLTARKTINQEVVRIAMETLSPLVTKTISNIEFHKNTVKFMVSKKPGDPRDLRKEYLQLRSIIHQGLLKIHLFSLQYTANYTFFVGSFGELCPRQCGEGHDETACSTLSGCYWSDSTQQCSDDKVLPEMKKVTVVFPCAKFEELTEDERNKSLDTIKNEVDKFIQGLPTGTKAQAFSLGDDFRDSFTFLVQGTARRAQLLDILTNISKWISEGQLQVVANNTYIRGQDVEDFNSIEIAMLFPDLEFFKLDLPQRRKLKQDLFHQLQSLLSSDFSIRDIHHVWFDQKYIIFKVQRDNLNSSVNKEIERWKQMLKLQAFSISLGHRRIHPTKLVYQKSLGGNCPISCFNRSSDSQCRKSLGCFYNGTWNVDHCQKKKLMGSSYVYTLFVACNATQTLNASERTEAEQDLREKLETLLKEAKEVLQDVIITEEGADIVLHATTLHPHLELYVETLNTEVDYTKGFRFGPSTQKNKFAPRKIKDSTNVDVILKFSSIDLEALQNLHLATREDISQDLQQQINTLLVGEVAQTFNLSWIKQDKLSFELKKSSQSKTNMAEEVDKIREAVKHGQITLHVHYIRPIVATEGHTVNTFKELCPKKYQHSSTVPPVITTVNSINSSFTTVIVPAVNTPELLVIYNASQISRSEANALVLDTVRTCFVEIHSCEYCSSQFSQDSCSFQPITTESPISTTNQAEVTTPVVSPDDRVYFGAVTITIMATSGCFLLALALWTADYVRKATTKKSKFKRKARKSEIEETQH